MGMAAAHLVSISGCRLRFSVCLLSVSLEEVWGGWKVGDERDSHWVCPYSFTYKLVFVWDTSCGKRESKLSFPSEVFHTFHLSICMTSTPSQAHLCGCWCVSTCWYPCTCDARNRPCKMVMWASDSPAFVNHPCCFLQNSSQQTDRNAHRHVTYSLKACSRKDCYTKIHLSRWC